MRGILLLICLVVGCTAHDSVQPEVPLPVKTMVLVSAEEPQVLVFSGKVEASKKVELAFQVPGQLVRLRVEEGQRVRKGEMIAQLRLGISRPSCGHIGPPRGSGCLGGTMAGRTDGGAT